MAYLYGRGCGVMGWLTGIFIGLFLSCTLNSIAVLVFVVYCMEGNLFTWNDFVEFIKMFKDRRR